MPKYENDLLNYHSKYTTTNDVLVNKLGLFDETTLNEAERMITSYKLAKLYLEPGEQTFDVKHYVAIHKYLFEEIYPFAGEIRRENISKRIPFCLVQYIVPELEKTLKKARNNVYEIDDREKLLSFITELYSDLDIIHPFREGNGRTEREFIRQFIDYICKTNFLEPYYLDYSLLDKDVYIDAVVRADAYCDFGPLKALFDGILVVKEKKENLNVEDGISTIKR